MDSSLLPSLFQKDEHEMTPSCIQLRLGLGQRDILFVNICSKLNIMPTLLNLFHPAEFTQFCLKKP